MQARRARGVRRTIAGYDQNSAHQQTKRSDDQSLDVLVRTGHNHPNKKTGSKSTRHWTQEGCCRALDNNVVPIAFSKRCSGGKAKAAFAQAIGRPV